MRKWALNWKLWAGLVSLAGAIAVYFILRPGMPRLALFWAFGLAFGFIAQRSRFCFVSAIGNFFLFKDGRLLKGILAGLFIATIGFSIIMYLQVSNPSTGMPATAYVAPFGWHLVLAGLLFGAGMMLAGGCIMGTLYRLGEGAVASVVALVGIIIGMGVLQHNWPWWDGYISGLPNIWLPSHIGWIAAVAVTLVAIALLYWLVWRVSEKSGVKKQTGSAERLPFASRVSGLGKNIITRGWPLAAGGILLGVGNIFLYNMGQRPWGIIGEVMRWTQNSMDLLHVPAAPVGTVTGT